MSDANFASLSSSLLARKGGAKPAMRPQSGLQGPVDGKAAAANLEDLGWNDMGEDAPAPAAVAFAAPAPAAVVARAQVVPIAPQAAPRVAAAAQPNQVRESIDRIAAHIERPAAPAAAAAPRPAQAAPVAAPAAPRPAPVRRPAAATAAALAAKRAAFTLRLDHERHLQLRLACTVRGRSAQQLVTDALDALLAEMPEIASLAAQVKRDSH